MRGEVSERAIVLCVAAAQFVNVLEFVIVMPLGPDYATALHVPSSHLSYVASAYTAAAALAGLLAAVFLDRFDRRQALFWTLAGLVVCTASAGLAQSFPMLIAVRAAAGLFGGPATSISMSIVADAVPSERRGRAMSIVLLSFSTAATLGVPAGLELARLAGWRAPFFVIAALGVLAVVLTRSLPPLTAHREAALSGGARSRLAGLLSNPTVLRSYAMTAAVQMSGFLFIPSISPFIQKNLGFPRARLGLLYLLGGVVNFASIRLSGRLVDRFGSMPVATIGLVTLAGSVVALFVLPLPVAWVPLVFCAYNFAMALRNLAYNTLASKVARPEQRASFQSLQSTVAHASIAAGSAIAAHMLSTGAHEELIGMPRVAWLVIAVSTAAPLLMAWVERDVRARDAA